MTNLNPPYASSNPSPSSPAAENPGRTLGIVGLVLAFFFTIVGAIIGIVALNRSKKAGYKNGPALAAIIVGFVLFVILIIIVIVAAVSFAGIANELLLQCEGLSGQQVTIGGQTVTCP